MTELKSRAIGYLIAAITAILTYVVFYGLASYFGAVNPHFIASALITVLVIHEAGHLLAFEANGIPARMFFLVILGGASPIRGYQSKFEQLPSERKASIILAGIGGNFIVMFGAYLLLQFNYLTYLEFLKILNLNGVLILWNLFPLWIFDGGHFAKLLFDSIPEDKDTKYAVILALGFFLALIAALIISGKISFVCLWLFTWGLHRQASHDDPYGSEKPEAIPGVRLKYWAMLYLIMISAGAILASVTPNMFD